MRLNSLFVRFMVLALTLLLFLPHSGAFATVNPQSTAVESERVTAERLLHYQGRLLDPSTGTPKPDATYAMIFRLFDANSGGAVLWEESKSVSVSNGLFSTLLGDATPLPIDIFDGRGLWMEVSVNGEALTPRHKITSVAYAIRAEVANFADRAAYAVEAERAAEAIHAGTTDQARDAELLCGQPASAFSPAGHEHNDLYVELAGDTMTGPLRVPAVEYTQPRSHTFIVGSEAFLPARDAPYSNSY